MNPDGPGRPDVAGAAGRPSLDRLGALDIEVAVRAAIAATVPLGILVAAGRPEWAAYAAFGAMTALFGRNEPYRLRLRTVTVAAVLLLASIGAGALLAVTAASDAVVGVVLGVLIVVGVLVVNVARLAPPTVLFFVFALLVCASAPTPSDELAPRLGVALASAGFAWLLSLSGSVLRRMAGPRGARLLRELEREAPVRRAAATDRAVWANAIEQVVAALAAGAVAVAFGLGHPYWAVVSVVAVIPPAGAARTLSRAWHRVLGTAGGVLVAAAVLWPDPPAWLLVVLIGLAQFGAEVLVGRHYGSALLCITPLALMVVHLSAPVDVGTLVVDRLVETALGCAIAMLAVLIGRAAAARGRTGILA
ncbi:FUSC family protein [Agromyces tropicus]|uniref:FUSC family protein n=1 Tax=Agromyces tropicus TaxID=555371 RepID=A0ABN2UYX9_9MICO